MYLYRKVSDQDLHHHQHHCLNECSSFEKNKATLSVSDCWVIYSKGSVLRDVWDREAHTPEKLYFLYLCDVDEGAELGFLPSVLGSSE